MDKKPYLIYNTAGYHRNSGGIRALHMLCHYLNEAGYDASLPVQQLNTHLNTKYADAIRQWYIATNGITVYPEVEDGNPAQSRNVVRYLLNIPGFFRPVHAYPDSDMIYCWHPYLTMYTQRCSGILHIPMIDLLLFNHSGISSKRKGSCFHVGKGKDRVKRNLFIEGKEITKDWPATHEELAALFKSVRVFYTYDCFTLLADEARACGCPVVVIASSNTGHDLEALKSLQLNKIGITYIPDNDPITSVLLRPDDNDVDQFYNAYVDTAVKPFPNQLAAFIERTQTWKLTNE